MHNKKKREPIRITKVGESEWPYLDKADYQFDHRGIFHTKLILPLHDAEPEINYIDGLIKSLKEDWAKTHGVAKKMPELKLPYEKLGDTVKFNFKLYASNQKKDGSTFTQRPDLKDRDNQSFPKDQQIWSGSTMRIAYEPVPYCQSGTGMGVSLRLKGAQIIELKQGGGIDFAPVTTPEKTNGSSSLPSDGPERF